MTIKRKQLGDLSEEFIKCRSRTWGHMWEDIPSSSNTHRWDIKPDALLRCVRCTTEKFLWLDAEGGIVGTPHYDYADGYKLAGLYQGDKLTLAELRAEIIARKRRKK